LAKNQDCSTTLESRVTRRGGLFYRTGLATMSHDYTFSLVESQPTARKRLAFAIALVAIALLAVDAHTAIASTSVVYDHAGGPGTAVSLGGGNSFLYGATSTAPINAIDMYLNVSTTTSCNMVVYETNATSSVPDYFKTVSNDVSVHPYVGGSVFGSTENKYTFVFPESFTPELARWYLFALNDCGDATMYSDSVHEAFIGITQKTGTELTDLIWGGVSDTKRPLVTLYDNGALSTADYIQTFIPCRGDSRMNTFPSCAHESATSTIEIATTVTHTTANLKLEVLVKNLDGETLKSTSYSWSASGVSNVNDHLVVPSTIATGTPYIVSQCLVPSDSSSYFGYGACVNAYVALGVATSTLNDLLADLGLTPRENGPSGRETQWSTSGCDSIGLTDVFKGIKCANIALFSPNQSTLESLKTLTLANRIPFSYAYDMKTVAIEMYASSSVATTSAISLPIKLPGHSTSTMTFLSATSIQQFSWVAWIRTFLVGVIWIMVGRSVYARVIRIYDTQTV